ncbi:MAG TPA: hypothetical protein VMB21_21510 [Candidatus Limnocylindria bacterium]|nr:hypothetical protein [Candidatus Limnocylindria bacterium]
MGAAKAFFAAELQRLMALPLTSEAELTAWYEASAKLETVMEQKFPELEFPHEIWHFLSDADIRAKDASYRDRQHRLIAGYIADLLKSD